jgi:hypothetical protein
MANSFQHQEFIKCQATDVLSRLPSHARQVLRYYEVAALLQDFNPQSPLTGPKLAGKRFWTFVVTDWHLYVLPSGTQRGSPGASLELPLLELMDVVSTGNGAA